MCTDRALPNFLQCQCRKMIGNVIGADCRDPAPRTLPSATLLLMASTAPRSSSIPKCPSLAAIFAMVPADHPTILAMIGECYAEHRITVRPARVHDVNHVLIGIQDTIACLLRLCPLEQFTPKSQPVPPERFAPSRVVPAAESRAEPRHCQSPG